MDVHVGVMRNPSCVKSEVLSVFVECGKECTIDVF